MKYDLFMNGPGRYNTKAIRDNALYQLTKFEAVWYFTKYEGKEDIIWGIKSESYEDPISPTRWIILEKKQDPMSFDFMTKRIREDGTKFYTNDADNSDSDVWGYYFNKDQVIDFEPLRLGSMPDLGHTYLFYKDKETRTYKEV
tara:strand:+ start:1264 stop:1692 length:429 start_codon:yes stop_codon:yes gene_type:complete